MFVDGPVTLSRPGLGERATVVLTFFLLGYGLPNDWIRTRVEDDAGGIVSANAGGDLLMTALLLGLIGFLLLQIVGHYRHLVKMVEYELLLPLFVGWLAASYFWSDDPALTFRRAGALVLVLLFGGYLVVRFDLADTVRMAAVAMGAGTILCYLFVFGLPSRGRGSISGDWFGVFDNRNGLGRISVLAAMIFLLSAREYRRFRVTYYGLAVAAAVLVLGSTSKTSFVTVFLLAALMCVYTAFRARKTLYGAVALSMVGSIVIAIMWVTANIGFITDSLDKDITLSGRIPLWKDLIPVIAKDPILGHGYNAFWGGYFSPAHEILIQNPWDPPHSHNAIFEYLLYGGIPAAVLFVGLFLRTVVRSARYVRYRPKAIGLFPLAYCSFVLLTSITEAGVVSRDIQFALFVVTVGTVTKTRRARAPEEAMAQDLSRVALVSETL